MKPLLVTFKHVASVIVTTQIISPEVPRPPTPDQVGAPIHCLPAEGHLPKTAEGLTSALYDCFRPNNSAA